MLEKITNLLSGAHLAGATASNTKSIDVIAQEVIDGKWGSGDTRKTKLIKAGYNYDKVQAKVNEILSIGTAISKAAKAQVAWEKNTVYKWEKQPTIIKSETHGTCVTYVACTLQRIGVLEPGQFVWTNGTGFGDGKVIGANNRMTVTYYKNKKTIKNIKSSLRLGDILIFNDNKSGKVGSCGHICIYNGTTYENGIYTFTGGRIISVNGKEKYTRKVFAVIRINSIPTRKTVDQLAREVIAGKWGGGDTRRIKLINAGYDYDAVQKRVNELLSSKPTSTLKPAPPSTPKKSAYSGTLPNTKMIKSNSEVIADAIIFAKWIVSDNRFGYGRMGGAKYKGTKEYKITHSGGCHFCGSNAHKISEAKKAGLNDPKEWEYTFVCSTFVHACYAHAGVQSMMKSRGHAWWTKNYRSSKDWAQIKKPFKVASLKPGDVLGNDNHYVIYIGNGKGAQATSRGNVRSGTKEWDKSINTFDITSFFKQTKYVFRYIGTVNVTTPLRYGEVGKRVGQWQKFLDWYYDGKVGNADNCFGDNTLKWTKKFQEEVIGKGQGDGLVGPKTLAVAAAVKK